MPSLRHPGAVNASLSFGQAGVERVLEILNTERRLAMVGCGMVTLKDITAKSLIDSRLRM